jgi:peptide-methionine (S)-S-oxide reductase
VIRTRVGYCGGLADSPDYRHIGDHSETLEIDYDPAVITYDDLLAEFFAGHDARARSYSVQYRSAIFYRNDDEWAAAERAIARVQDALGGRVRTVVEPLMRFWIAEGYHQKFRLRGHPAIAAEMRALFPDERAFVDSTAVARLNGWLDGWGSAEQIERELPLIGLGAAAQEEIRRFASPRIHEARPIAR